MIKETENPSAFDVVLSLKYFLQNASFYVPVLRVISYSTSYLALVLPSQKHFITDVYRVGAPLSISFLLRMNSLNAFSKYSSYLPSNLSFVGSHLAAG